MRNRQRSNLLTIVLIKCAIIIFGVTLAWAGSVGSVRDLPDVIVDSQHGRLSQADITILGVRIGRETLDDVQSQFGDVKITRIPQNSVSANDEVCYSSNNSADQTHLVFGSGPMGGWQYITTFQIHSRAPTEVFCKPSLEVSHSASTLSGIRLDMTVNELNSKLGKPTQQGRDFVIYSFAQENVYPEKGTFTMLSGVEATTTNNRVTSLMVFLIESN